MKVLGEIRVEEREGVIALIVRTTRPLLPWDVWLIIDVDTKEDRLYDDIDGNDLTYGHSSFRAIRGLQKYYSDIITSFAAKYGSTFTEKQARKRARRKLDKFVTWRDKQRKIEEELDGRPALR